MEIPHELRALVRLRFDDEVKQIGPPENILDEVEAVLGGSEPSEALVMWIADQRGLHERAQQQLDRLWDAHGDVRNGLPAWLSFEWAYILHFPWSRHLRDAVQQAEQWV